MNDRNSDKRGAPDNGAERADEAFVARAARLFDDSVNDLDAATRSRLNRSRQRALAAAAPRSALPGPAWLPAGAAAAVAVLAVGAVLLNGGDRPGVAPDGLPLSSADPAMAPASDLDILMDQDSLEMLEDLEFYSWLELDEAGDGEDSGENVG